MTVWRVWWSKNWLRYVLWRFRYTAWQAKGKPRYKALSWSSGKPLVTAAASIPFSTILSSSDPGVTSNLLFKSGRGFLEWFSCGKRGGIFPPLDTESVSEISDERSPSVVEDTDEPSRHKKWCKINTHYQLQCISFNLLMLKEFPLRQYHQGPRCSNAVWRYSVDSVQVCFVKGGLKAKIINFANTFSGNLT